MIGKFRAAVSKGNLTQLKALIDIDHGLLDQLLDRKVITAAQRWTIQSAWFTEAKKVDCLIEILCRRPDDDFFEFCKSLCETNQKHVVTRFLFAELDEDERHELRQLYSIKVARLQETAHDERVLEQPTDEPSAVNTDIDHDNDWKNAKIPTFISAADIKVVGSSLDFYNQWKNKSYPMSTKPRGKFLLICNNQFAKVTSAGKSQCTTRQGAENDGSNLEELFKQLHFEVDRHDNLTANEMLQLVNKTSRDPSLSTSQCFAMCVMSHGRLIVPKPGETPVDSSLLNVEVIFGSDAQPVATMRLFAPFADENCAMLRNKPRIVLVQACRGDSVDKSGLTECDAPTDNMEATNTGGVTTTTSVVQLLDEPSYTINKSVSFKDFIFGYPTQSGFRSFRNTVLGSWYLIALTWVFAESAHDTEVSAMLRMVNSYVCKWVSDSDDPQVDRGTQVGSVVDNLTQAHLHLFPGITE